ncbi:hypothetical protein ATCC90586_011825 [Pythium insidiosum]|nr:hypothetical protein ATCC90586_011825 [Pythium insidiosum]
MISGDVLQMLRVFPTLVDSYIAIAWARDNTKNGPPEKESHRMRPTDGTIAGEKTTTTATRTAPLTMAAAHNPPARKDASDDVALQLRDIQDAFRMFKSV